MFVGAYLQQSVPSPHDPSKSNRPFLCNAESPVNEELFHIDKPLNKRHLSPFCKCYMAQSLSQKPTIHHVTTMLATSKNVLFPGHNHRY